MPNYALRELLTEEQRGQFDAMYALDVQNRMAYSREARRRGLVSTGNPEHDWFKSTDDPYLKGWQAAISAMAHTFGEALSATIDSNRKK